MRFVLLLGLTISSWASYIPQTCNIPGFGVGSVLFTAAGPVCASDTANFNYNPTTHTANIDNLTQSPGRLLWTASLGDTDQQVGVGTTALIPTDGSGVLWNFIYSGTSVNVADGLQVFILQTDNSGFGAISAISESSGVDSGGAQNALFASTSNAGTNNIANMQTYTGQTFTFSSGNVTNAVGFFQNDGFNGGAGRITNYRGFDCAAIAIGTTKNECYSSHVSFGSGHLAFDDSGGAGVQTAGVYQDSSAAPGISGCNAATIDATSTNMSGIVTAQATGACVIALTFTVSYPHSTNCFAFNVTTPADTFRQSAQSPNSVTFTGTSLAGDTVRYGCAPGF